MKVLIVEEALKDLHGHWFQYISDIVEGGRQAGHDIEVAVHKNACAEILKGLPCHPILSSSVFGNEAGGSGARNGLRRVFHHNRSLYKDLRQFLEKAPPYDVIIATTPRLDHLLAYEWLHWRLRRGQQRWVLIFVEAVGRYSADYSQLHFPWKSLPLKLAFKMTRLLPKRKQFMLMTESVGLARQFEQFCGIPFGLVPHVTHLPSLAGFGRAESPGIPPRVLGTYGFTRYDKGLDVLQAAIRTQTLANRNPRLQFVLQWTGDYCLPDGSWARKDPALEQAGVEYIPPFQSSDQYFAWLAKTDIMVLPYRKDFYYDKLSRVAIDAAIAGMPLVYPMGTWLEWFVKHHAVGVGFVPEDPASLAQAMGEAADNFPDLKRQAKQLKQATAEAFSARTFFEIIAAGGGLSR